MNLPNQGTLPLRKIILGLAIIGLLIYLWLRPSSNRDLTRAPQTRAPQMAQAIETSSYTANLPLRGGPEGYIGSSSCQSCHEKQHASWHQSYHRTMTQALTPNTVRADFNQVSLDSHGERFHLSQTNGNYWVSIGDTPPEGQESDPALDPVQLQLAMMTGSHHMQVFWLPGTRGNMQIGFPFTWLIEDERWVPRHDTFIRDPDAEPVVEVWNKVCIRCHTTGGIPKPNAQAGIFESEAAELGISCEACHGPAEQHVALRAAEKTQTTIVAEKDDPIIQPANLAADRSSQVCGACHSMKWFDKNEQWEAHGFRFRPGDDLNETTPIIRASNTEDQPWLHSVLERNPGLLESFFWPDGMIRVSGREYNGLVESACHTKGEMSCLSCHSLHSSDPNDQLARNRTGNQACIQCHTEMGDSLTEHTHHAAESSGSECYNCHMPHTTYGILKAIRSHEIDSPTVIAEKETGRPNACNLCHANQTLAWTADYLQEWYAQTVPDLTEEDRSLPAVPRHLLEGDAAQRALAAWTLGWQPSQAAAGNDWQAGVLAEALTDSYSAVRYIAGKSLSRYPGFEAFDYDFVDSPQNRSTAAQQAKQLWQANRPANTKGNPSIEFFDESGFPRETIIKQLLSGQDKTPVRLRE